jgi:hypothetical protein
MTREHQLGGSHEQHSADAPRQCNAAFCRLCLQFERTLIVAEDDAYVSYLEGCTAPAYDSNQLHAAVVELSAGVASCNNAMHCAVCKLPWHLWLHVVFWWCFMALHEGLQELGMAAIICMMNLLFTVTHQLCFR